MAHRHTCIDCGTVLEVGDFDCESDTDHDFALCEGCASQPRDNTIEFHVSSAAEARRIVQQFGDKGSQWEGLPQGRDTDPCLVAEVETKGGLIRLYAPKPEDAIRIWNELF